MSQIPFSNAHDNSELSLKEKIALFGDDAIPLIIPWGSKGAPVPGSLFNRYMKDWSKRTLADTLDPDYQHDLYTQKCNVAIRQGGGLTRVCAWDFDTDDPRVAAEFFAANPFFVNTVFTVGARGFTAWCKMKGPYPMRKVEVDVRGEKVEWRGNGYSVIHGLHPSGRMYRIYSNLPEGVKSL